MSFDKVAVLDFGGQYAHLIATKIRRLRVLCEIKDPQDPLDSFREYKGIVLSGSPALASKDEDADWTRAILDLDAPVLGLCFGHQEIAKHYGGEVEHSGREYGPAELHIDASAGSVLFHELGPVERVWMSHGDTVTRLPEGFVELGWSTAGSADARHPNAAIGSDRLRRYGFQYHPEVDDTVHGERMLANFLFGVCGCRPDWTMENFLGQALESIRREVGERRVLLLASGGIDSTVTAKLLALALGPERLHLVHVDTGLMRRDESRLVVEELRKLGLGASLHFVDASAEFLAALAGLVDPERKRRAIGDAFVAVSDREARRAGLHDVVLGQGTIYPDTIETGGTKRADVIKTHHNRVPVIEQMIREGRVVEPLKELYKVEVRELARELGLDERALERHPFPGPGLGIRALCASGPVPGDDAGEARALAPLLEGTGLQGRVLPVRSVGVKADLRSYERPVLLAGAVPPAHDGLLAVSARVYKEVPGVNRCILRLDAPALPARVEVVPATVTRERLELLRDLDAWVMSRIERHGLMSAVWQCPTVLVPLALDGRGRELVVLRPVLSERGMTARPAPLPAELVREVVERFLRRPEVSAVALDLTTKPPGTIEWE